MATPRRRSARLRNKDATPVSLRASTPAICLFLRPSTTWLLLQGGVFKQSGVELMLYSPAALRLTLSTSSLLFSSVMKPQTINKA